MDKKCSTCRHWRREARPYPRFPTVEFRSCKRIPHGDEIGEWDDDFNNVLKPEYAGTLAVANDGSGYHAELATAADFFCAHWEAQPHD